MNFDSLLVLRPLIEAAISVFIIMDPIGNIPIFMTLTHNKSKAERKKIFRLAILTAYILLLTFTFGGTAILHLFKITLPDFQIAGGLLLLAISLKILTVGHYALNGSSDSLGAVPIACPLLVGPGAMTAAMVANAVHGTGITLLAVTLAFLLTAIILAFTEDIYLIIGKVGSEIASKITAILMAAIAIQYIRAGIVTVVEEIIKR